MVAQVDFSYIRTRPVKLLVRLISYALFEGRPLTTRGQWINPMLSVLFAIQKRLPQLKKIKKPIFIVGTGRSGTTILGVLLSMHCEIGFLNEPKALWHSIYPDEDLIGSYSRGIGRYRLGGSDVTGTIKRHAHRIYGAYLASVFSRRVVDKYPEMIFRIPFVKSIFPDAKFLFLVRNGWDTCHSIEGWSTRMGKQMGDEIHDWWGVNRRKWNLLVDQLVPDHSDLAPHAEAMYGWSNHTDMAALEWILTMREGLKLKEDYPHDILQISYECLSEQPKQELAKIMAFLDLSEDSVFMEYARKTLFPAEPCASFELHATLIKPFNETMRRLGYAT